MIFWPIAKPLAMLLDWALGEESTADESLSTTEQILIDTFLSKGGRMLISGAELGWDLDQNGTAADRAFYRNTIGAVYVADGVAVELSLIHI